MQKSRVVSLLICFVLLLGMLMLVSCGDDKAAEQAGEGDHEQQHEQQQEQQNQQQDQQTELESEEKTEEIEEIREEPVEEGSEEETEVNTDNITINTQSSIKIEGSKTIYLDPYKRTKAAHDADIIFLTHAHYDHYDEPSLRNSAREDSVIVCPASMLADVTRMNVRGLTDNKDADIIGMKAGEKKEVAEGVTVEAVPAYNLNKNYHPKANGWLGYIITMDGVRYYAAGDTDALPELEDIECDIAFVPVGGTFTETAAEAADLVNKIHPLYAIPIHYGTIVGRAADADTFGAALESGIEMVKKVEDAR